MWKESKCKGTWLHRFEIKREFDEGVEEICLICKKKMYFMYRNGRPNNKEYIKYHGRQALPRWHKLSKHEYNANI